MIQRIQSLWLLLASAAAFASYKFPYYSGTSQKGVADHQLNATENFLLIVVTGIIAVLALFLIFLFKKRALQLRLCLLGILLEALLIVSTDGKVVYRNSVQLQPGSTVLNADISNLPSGIYMIKGEFSDGQTNAVKFIKQ